MDSPRSEKSDTRFSTPASELDDHRNLPSSLPRVLTLGTLNDNQGGPNPSRRDTMRASFNNDRTGIAPDIFPPFHTNQEPQYLARDFEQAIVDDDKSFAVSTHGLTAGSPVHRRRSLSSAVGRQGSLRVQNATDRTTRSRASSASSRSESPPNSVKAFANPRLRERAGTINSKAPSEHEYGAQRTISGGTHRRRPTFTDGNTNNPGLDSDDLAKQGSAEEDVCFPPSVEEQLRPNEIDYEVLDEFVVEYGKGRSSAAPDRRRRQSMSSQSRLPNFFKDLRPQGARQAIPEIFVPGVESESEKEDQLSGFDGKCDSGLALRPTISARQYSQYEPGRFSFFSSELDSTILAPDLGDLLLPGESFHDLFGRVPEEGVWWLDVLDPNRDEINAICKAFGIHPLTCEDIKTQEAREKVELFPRYYFVCFRSFDQRDKSSEDYMEPVSVYIVVFREGVLSFTFTPNQHAANVRKRIGKLRDYVALHSDWICYALIDEIVDQFAPVIHDIEKETDSIEDHVFIARADDFAGLLRQIGECRKKVMSLMRLLGGKADVIKGFAKRCNEQYPQTPRQEIGLYLGDVQDHIVTMMSNLSHAEKMLSRSHSNYLAQVSVDGIAQGNEANRILSKITIIATILVPLNLVCGLFGMNVPVPGRQSTGLGWFFGIIGFIGVIVALSLIVAKRSRLI